jgi:hypothetical protein
MARKKLFLVTAVLGVFFLSFSTASAEILETILTEDWESGQGNWTISNGVWEVGFPTAGPTDCRVEGSTGCAGTVLDDNYPGDTDSRLISPPVQLPTVDPGERISLSFWQWFSYAGCDQGLVQISVWDQSTSTWSAWTNVDGTIVDNSPWSRRLDDLTSYAGEIVRIAFYHTAQGGGNCSSISTGWYVDDIEIIKYSPAFSGGFETGWDDWGADRGVWQVGTPTAGPFECNGGSQCAGTVLNTNYPGATDSRLISPPVQLPTVDPGERISLSFWQWFSYAGCDIGYVQISVWDQSTSTWSAWTNVDGTIVDNSPWSRRLDDLTSYAGKIVRIAFYHTAQTGGNCSSSSTGWYIDDIELIKHSPAISGDFETGWDDWGADRGVWQVGTPTAGPSECNGGSQCAGTVLDGDYPGATDSRLISAPIQLQNTIDIFAQEPSLRFWHWFSYAGCDQGFVQISVWDQDMETWSDWQTIGNTVTGISSVWSSRRDDLSAFVGKIVRIAFYHTAQTGGNCSSSSTGWYVDDIRLPGVFLLPCEGDFDNDGDVDGSDLSKFAGDFGRTDCSLADFCTADFDADGDVDGSDLFVFVEDFGKTDCFDRDPFE